MNFKIHRGTKEIGGSCVEIWTDTSRIVIDLGMPLVNGGFQSNNLTVLTIITYRL
jgi:Cft2 family RNA processing exonuclease